MASKKGVFGESKVNRGAGLFLIQIKLYFWTGEGRVSEFSKNYQVIFGD